MLEGTAGRASELRQQGALEASRDPNSGVDAAQAEQKVLDEAKASGAPAFEFDSDASPEQKKAQMQAVRVALSNVRSSELTSSTASTDPETA